MFERHDLVYLMLPTVVYHQWFQPLIQAVHTLPDRVVRDGGIGVSYEKDHPSRLIARSELLFGPNECLEDLVTSVVGQRQVQCERLVTALRAALELGASRNEQKPSRR
jgi:hypothetical protein